MSIYKYLPLKPYYIELFGFTGTFYVNRESVAINTFNDVNNEIYNLFQMMRVNKKKLFATASDLITPFSLNVYEEGSNINLTTNNDYSKALNTLVCLIQSGKAIKQHAAKGKKQKTNLHLFNYVDIPDFFKPAFIKFKYSQIEHDTWEKLIKRYDNKDALFFADPLKLIDMSVTYQEDKVNELLPTQQTHDDLLDALISNTVALQGSICVCTKSETKQIELFKASEAWKVVKLDEYTLLMNYDYKKQNASAEQFAFDLSK